VNLVPLDEAQRRLRVVRQSPVGVRPIEVALIVGSLDRSASFERLNAVYARHMPDPPPARSAPANVRLAHGLLVSIEAIALLPDQQS
jgi:hypothetical protein